MIEVPNNIIKVRIYKDTTYVLTFNGILLVFDKDGNSISEDFSFSRKDTNLRRGKLTDFDIDNDGNLLLLFVFEYTGIQVVKYKNDGTFIWNYSYSEPNNRPQESIFAIQVVDNNEAVIAYHNILYRIDPNGTIIRQKSFGSNPDFNNPLYVYGISFSDDYVAVLVGTSIEQVSEVVVLDSSLDVLKVYKTPISNINTQTNIGIKIVSDYLIVATTNTITNSDGTESSRTHFVKTSVLKTENPQLSCSYSNILLSFGLQKTIEGNKDHFYGYTYQIGTEYPILYKFDYNFNIVTSKVIEQQATKDITGKFSGFNVVNRCLIFSTFAISDTEFSFIPDEFTSKTIITDTSWIIKTDDNLDQIIGSCILITQANTPNKTVDDLKINISDQDIIIPESGTAPILKSDEVFSLVLRNEYDCEILDLCPIIPKISYTQSPLLYLQAAGSTGADGSAKGVHLRWLFKNELGDKHLAKGNLAEGTSNFNKANDVVKICKIPYEKVQITIDFSKAPDAINSLYPKGEVSRHNTWVYSIEGNRYFIIFRNSAKYNQTLSQFGSPNANPAGFIKSYNDVIEIHTAYSLAFSVEFVISDSLPSSTLQTELIGEEDKILNPKKGIIARKTFNSNQLPDTYQLAENIKQIRFKATNCTVTEVKVELYATVVDFANLADLWQDLGDYALTTDNTTALNYLEPTDGLIHGKWPRYNEGDCVNIENYKEKWDNPKKGLLDKDIKEVVQDFIRLSNTSGNPRGMDSISFSEDGLDKKEFSFLDLLNIAAADYHVARILGLGTLDLDPETNTKKFVYVMKYTTNKKVKDYIYDEDSYEVEHIYTSLPTSTEDQRLPLDFGVEEVIPGVPSKTPDSGQLDSNGNFIKHRLSLLDKNGYSNEGKSRFVSIFPKEIEDDELLDSTVLSDFYNKTKEFNSSEFTVPVYGGIELKKFDLKDTAIATWTPKGSPWDKPELSITDLYKNAVKSGNATPEIVPLTIPDNDEPLYVHRQTQDGHYFYGTYGINWFGRTNPATEAIGIETEFIPDNTLLPPHNTNVLHIVEERPLLLTSTNEQLQLDALVKDKSIIDKTLVRLTFDYDATQELISYKVSDDLLTREEERFKGDLKSGDNVLLHSDSVFKDEKEIFADEIEIFFRNEVPQNIRGKVTHVTDHPSNKLLAVVHTGKYLMHSQNDPRTSTVQQDSAKEFIIPEIPNGVSPANFNGGIIVIKETNFYIESIRTSDEGVIFNVYKNEASDEIPSGIVPREGVELKSPEIFADALFMAIENMSSATSWGGDDSSSAFKIKTTTPNNSAIHREVIINKNSPDDSPEKILEKTRGYWSTAKISKKNETIDFDEDGKVIEGHKGLYEIQFPFQLDKHPQDTQDEFDKKENSVAWNGGSIRVHTTNDPTGPRKNFKVIKLINVGTSDNLIAYAEDPDFKPYDFLEDKDGNPIIDDITNEKIPVAHIIEGESVEVNFYPGYKVYLYADPSFNLTNDKITPKVEDLKYSIFGFRSVDNNAKIRYKEDYKSNISAPSLMFVHKIIDPQRPELPSGALYATQPDTFGKATYTLTSKFSHQPYGVLYHRANDRLILGAIYKNETIDQIFEKLNALDPDVFYADRWKNLLSFNFNTPTTNGQFEMYPKKDGYRFPKVDKPSFFEAINAEIEQYNLNYATSSNKIALIGPDSKFDLNTIIIPEIIERGETFTAKTITTYVEKAIMSAFVSLTEVPILYDHVRSDINYQPTAKKQVIRDRNGNLLSPGRAPYDNAPMAKRLDTTKDYDNILFTDFGLDGTSKNAYFYALREVGSTTQIGPFSPVIGPIKLVNSKAPETPQIKRVLPILASDNFGFKQVPLSFVDIENIEISENTTLTKTGADSDNAGVASKQILKGNSFITFNAIEGSVATIGFSSFNINSDFKTIQFALRLNANGNLEIYENGENLGFVGTYTKDTLFRIEIKGNKIIYSRDEVVLYDTLLVKASEFIVDISLHSTATQLSNIALYTKAPYYDTEVLNGEIIPLTYFDLNSDNNIKIEGTVISKPAGATTEKWDAGAFSNEYMPFYGVLSYKVLAKTNVVVGLATVEGQDNTNKITYALWTKDDGYLEIQKNGVTIQACTDYNENSLLEIERRNAFLIFKKDGRIFYELLLESNIPLLVDFSMFKNNSEIIDLQMKATKKVSKNNPTDIINPALAFEINAYPKDQGIRKLNLYRTKSPENSLSIRTMDLVNSVDLILTDQLDKNVWHIKDEFLDLDFVPYSEPLFYKITVSRAIEYAKTKLQDSDNTILVAEYTPSKASKLLISSIVESTSPEAPIASYGFDALGNNAAVIDNVLLKWTKTVHNGKYHIYKMNSQGNWVKIHELVTNDDEIQLFLNETDNDGLLQIEDTDSNPKYHHFKIDAENSVGMLNTKSNILTIPNESGIASLEGIGSMVVENTNLVR